MCGELAGGMWVLYWLGDVDVELATGRTLSKLSKHGACI